MSPKRITQKLFKGDKKKIGFEEFKDAYLLAIMNQPKEKVGLSSTLNVKKIKSNFFLFL